MMKNILQIFSFLGAFLGLLVLIYLPFVIWSILFSFFFIIWGIISFLYCTENSKYRVILRIFSFTGLFLGIIFILFSLWGFISVGFSLIMRNFLILSLILGIFTFIWAMLALKCLKIVSRKSINNEKNKK